MFSAISPTNLSAWLITMDGVGYGVIGLAPTLEDAISQGLLLSA